jgi:glycerol-3-phosphate dehydrogenase subunit C
VRDWSDAESKAAMTTTYDPHHPQYLDEADVRKEMTRVFDLCHGCRLCFKLCTSFPTMFEFIDRHDDQDAGRLTPAQQDRVVDECFQCKLCFVNCPYVPGQHDWAIDFPRLMLRADAVRYDTDQVRVRHRATTQMIARTDLVGRVGSVAAPTINRVLAAKPGSIMRTIVEKASGVSSVRLLPPFARQRFSTWFKRRPKVRIGKRQGRVALFPTCLVEYQEPAIGHDLVKVYERNGIEVTLGDAGCCGAPWLHSGDMENFIKVAVKNVRELAAEVRKGKEIVVPQPTCGYVLKNDYPAYAPGPDSTAVAEHTYDAAEYLMKVHRTDGGGLDTEFGGEVPDTITYHTPCHLRAQNIGLKSRDLMKLTGAKIKLVQQCSGIDGMWGLRAENAAISVSIAKRLGTEIIKANCQVVAGDCHLANTAITEQTGEVPLHPIQVVARAYGIAAEETLR